LHERDVPAAGRCGDGRGEHVTAEVEQQWRPAAPSQANHVRVPASSVTILGT